VRVLNSTKSFVPSFENVALDNNGGGVETSAVGSEIVKKCEAFLYVSTPEEVATIK
jgi:hypothetical protein